MLWHALAPLCPFGELQTAVEGTRPVAFVLGFGLFCTNSQGRDPSTRRGAGPTAAILTWPFGLLSLCSGVPWRCDVSCMSGVAVLLCSLLRDGRSCRASVNGLWLLRFCSTWRAAPPTGGYALSIRWCALATATMCAQCLYMWVTQSCLQLSAQKDVPILASHIHREPVPMADAATRAAGAKGSCKEIQSTEEGCAPRCCATQAPQRTPATAIEKEHC